MNQTDKSSTKSRKTPTKPTRNVLEPTFWETSTLSVGHRLRNSPKNQINITKSKKTINKKQENKKTKIWETLTRTHGTSLPFYLLFIYLFIYLLFLCVFGETGDGTKQTPRKQKQPKTTKTNQNTKATQKPKMHEQTQKQNNSKNAKNT